ncbi:MAG: phospholipase [Rhodoferax sp.]|nr:phospholipase [Rhodoferax sp.]
MTRFALTLAGLLSLCSSAALAWGNHSFAAYRAFERMPEVANAAPVPVQSLEAFLKAEEKAIEALLKEQEAWASANLEYYPARPAVLAFVANPARSDEARRLAFLMALRVAPNSKLALYVQPDPQIPFNEARALPHSAVNTLPEPADSTHRFAKLALGESVTPLEIVASASDEPDYGLDINLWGDSPSDWGKVYGFGPLSFGNPAVNFATQSPFHMGFFHESRVIYLAAPFLKKTFPLWRVHQYTGLAALAWRSGHPYWGWRFAGLALHYVQDLTQPYHASVSPGDGTLKLIGTNLLAMAGMPRMKNELIVLLSNRHLALEKYQRQLLRHAALTKQSTAIEEALRNGQRDASYPAWSERYTRDVVAREAHDYGVELSDTLMATLPPRFVSDPAFDFGVKEAQIDILAELGKQDPTQRAQLDAAIAKLLGHFGAHSRNVLRGALQAGGLRP